MKLFSRTALFFIVLVLMAAGPGMVCVGGADDHGDDAASATILSVVISDNINEEPGNSYAGGSIEDVNDTDYFCVDITENCFFTVFFYSTEEANIALLNPSGETILTTQGIPGKLNEHDFSEYDHTVIDKIGLTPGRYCITLQGSETLPLYYAIALQAQKASDNTDDHGNSMAEASPAESSMAFNGFSGCLEQGNDIDFFSFELSDFYFSCPNRDSFNFIDFILMDNAGNQITAGPLTEFDAANLDLEPGNYYMSLTSNNGRTGCYSVCTFNSTFLQPDGMASGVVFPPNAHADITLAMQDEFFGGLIYKTDTVQWGNSGAWWLNTPPGTYELTIEADGYETAKKEVSIDYGTETQTGSVVLTPLLQDNCGESSHAVVQSNLDLFFPCIVIGEEGYSLTLKNATDPFQFEAFIWSLDMNSITPVCSSGCSDMQCIQPGGDMTISVPCAQYQGATYGFDLKLNLGACADDAMCWELDPLSFH